MRDQAVAAAVGGASKARRRRPGELEPGNINLFSRPRVRNPDDSVSTVRSMSINEDGVEILIPTVEKHGRGILSDEEAIEQYHATGEHLGKFKTPEAATAFAAQLHEAFARGDYDVPLAGSRRRVNPAQLAAAVARLRSAAR